MSRSGTRALETENEARKKAEQALRQSQKMEAVGQLTGGVAHDFNNLLTIVQGGLDMIGRQIPGLESSPGVSRIVRGKDMAIEGVRRAARLTSRLLAFARQQPLDPKNIDVNRLVAATCELLRRTLGEAVSLETVLAGGLWRALVDSNQLENALVNVALNARDAMPNGGKVTIETANCHLDEAYVENLAEPIKAGQFVMIAVADTGIGIDSATLEQVFEPFFTTKPVGKGTGLGLSQVYGFVRQSEGHVRIYSEPGSGTTVKIYLPRHLGAEEHPEEMDRISAASHAIGAESILVVEDDDALRAYAVEVLNDLGYSVVAAPDAVTALKILEVGHDVDLLFTDVVIPGAMNGRQLADEAVRLRPGLKVLFTTGYTRNAIVHHGRLVLGVDMIGKPFTFQRCWARGFEPCWIVQRVRKSALRLVPDGSAAPSRSHDPGSRPAMKLSIATVSLSGDLAEKLAAISAAGFKGVEIFENDLLSFHGTPAEARKMVDDLGLEIITFQPFRDFEGMPADGRERIFARAERKFDLMAELGCDLLLVCSNVSPQSLGGIERAAADLRGLGERAARRGMRIGFEALAWGRHINDYRDAWEAVRRADHEAVGLVLDTFHIFARKTDLNPIRSIARDRIALVQVADAPLLDMDSLSWSRHFRNFPGQGDLPLIDFMETLQATGFDGLLSLEIFNDQFRAGSARSVAVDGQRSLMFLLDQLHERTGAGASALPPRSKCLGTEFIEFAIDESAAPSFEEFLRGLGFTRSGLHKSKAVTRWSQGSVNIVVNSETEGFAHSFNITHGTAVCAIGLKVEDAAATLNRAQLLHDRPFRQAVGPGELEIPAVRGLGGSLVYFGDAKRELGRDGHTESAPTGAAGARAAHTTVDHISQSMHYEEMLSWVLFYTSLLDLRKTPEQDVLDPGGLVKSQAVQSGRRRTAHRAQCLSVDPHAVFPLPRRGVRVGGAAYRARDRRHGGDGAAPRRKRRRAAAHSGELLRRSRGQDRSRARTH